MWKLLIFSPTPLYQCRTIYISVWEEMPWSLMGLMPIYVILDFLPKIKRHRIVALKSNTHSVQFNFYICITDKLKISLWFMCEIIFNDNVGYQYKLNISQWHVNSRKEHEQPLILNYMYMKDVTRFFFINCTFLAALLIYFNKGSETWGMHIKVLINCRC